VQSVEFTHVFEHELFEQTWLAPQTFPHEPQFASSVFVFAQYGGFPVQNVCELVHVLVHELFTQTRFVPQTFPHDPQFAVSVFVFAQYGGLPVQNI
jgi:hypothetical protein